MAVGAFCDHLRVKMKGLSSSFSPEKTVSGTGIHDMPQKGKVIKWPPQQE
jgi:hypothetical protein